MEFLVEMHISIPPELGEEARAQLLKAEAHRGRELRRQGTIARIWRVPGRTANVGIWRAADASELHDAIASLPLFPYLDVDVRALATHYLEADSKA